MKPDPANTLETSAAERPAAMVFIMLTVLIDMISIGLIIPVMPALIGQLTSSQADQALWYGLIGFTFGLANFFASPVLGALSDAYGRRPVLLLGFCGLALNFFATALASSLITLILVRIVGGAMQANQAVANAYVADITPPEKRAKRFGMLGAMFGLGFIIGPVMGGLLGAINIKLPFFVAGGMAMLNLLYGYFVLPESLPIERRHAFHWRTINPLGALRDLRKLTSVGPLVAVLAFAGLAQFIMYSSWVLFTTLKFGWTPLQNGWSLAAVGVMSVIVQGLLLGRLLRRFSPRRLAIMGLISSTVAYLLFGLATEGWMMFVIIFINVFGLTVTASFNSIISGAAEAHKQGQTMGAISSLNSLMTVIAPAIGAPLLGFVSHYPQGDWRIGAPFYFCSLLQAIALWLAYGHFRRRREIRLDTAP